MGKERLLRLTPDINRLEFRFYVNSPLFKIDLFIKVDLLQGVFITNNTRLLLKKLNVLHRLIS